MEYESLDENSAPSNFDGRRLAFLYYDSPEVNYSKTRLVMGPNDLLSAIGGGLGLFLGLSIYSMAGVAIDCAARATGKDGLK